MKIIQRIVIALAIMFATMVTAQAETDLSKRTHYDGQAAINAIDAMGLEVIPRKELEEVRGEVTPPRWLIVAVGKALGNKTAGKLDSFLRAVETPTYAEYKAQFGSKTAAVLALLPWYLKPTVVE